MSTIVNIFQHNLSNLVVEIINRKLEVKWKPAPEATRERSRRVHYPRKIERAQTLEVRRPTDNAINEPGYVHDELNKFLEICTELSWIRMFAWFEFAIESKRNWDSGNERARETSVWTHCVNSIDSDTRVTKNANGFEIHIKPFENGEEDEKKEGEENTEKTSRL